MARKINNVDDLEIAIKPLLEDLVNKMADTVYQILNYFLYKYYQSYSPVFYHRSKDFLHSAIKTKAKVTKHKAEAYVYIDYDSLDNYGVSGYQVVAWANEGLHGGQSLGHSTPRVWDDTMGQTVDNGMLLKEAMQYLRSRGITVHT